MGFRDGVNILLGDGGSASPGVLVGDGAVIGGALEADLHHVGAWGRAWPIRLVRDVGRLGDQLEELALTSGSPFGRRGLGFLQTQLGPFGRGGSGTGWLVSP